MEVGLNGLIPVLSQISGFTHFLLQVILCLLVYLLIVTPRKSLLTKSSKNKMEFYPPCQMLEKEIVFHSVCDAMF